MNKTAILNVLNSDISNHEKAAALANLATTQFEEALGSEPNVGNRVVLATYMEGWSHGWDERGIRARARFYQSEIKQ